MNWQPETIHIKTWPMIHAVLAPVLERNGEDVVDLIDLLIANKNQLWVLRKGGDPIAAAVTELEHSPRGLLVHGRLLAGVGFDDWRDDLIDSIAGHARSAGAVAVYVEARPGFERALKSRGWKRTKIVMELPLEEAA